MGVLFGLIANESAQNITANSFLLDLFNGILVVFVSSFILLIITLEYRFKKNFLVVKKTRKITLADCSLEGPEIKDFYLKRKDQDDTSGKYIEDIIIERLKRGRDTLISGQADSGKTRMAYEVLRSLGKDYVFFIPFIDKSVNIDEISLYLCLRICSIRKKKYVFFFDDIQKYKTPLGIPDAINKIANKGFDTVILATIREGVQEDDLRKSPLLNEKRFSYLRDRENNIVVPSLTGNEAEDIAEGTGNEIPAGFDGNLTAGMIVSGWKKIRDQYRIVADRSPQAKRLVDINRIIYDLGLSRTDYDRVNCILSVIDDEKLSKKEYNEGERVLRESSVIGWNEKGYWLSGGKFLEDIVSGDVLQVPDLDKIIQCFSENKDYTALFEIAFSLNIKREYEEAINAYSEVISIKPDLHEAWNNWGLSLSDLALQVYPDDPGRGGELFGEAFEKYGTAVEIKPDDHEAWYNWGNGLSDLALQVYPDDPGRGGELFGEAFEKYRTAVEIKPDDHETWYNWGSGLSDLARQVYSEDHDRGRELFGEAFEKYGKAIEIKPNYPEAWNNWGIGLSNLAEEVYLEDPTKGKELFKDANEKYKKAIESKRDYYEALNNLGTGLSTLARQVHPEDPTKGKELFEDAIEKYRKAVEIKPDSHQAWNNLGSGLYDLALQVYPDEHDRSEELYEEAFEKYLKAIEFKPDYHEAWYNWGTTLSNFALQVYPDDPHRGGELFEDAFEKYDKAIESKPYNPEAWYNWGTALYDLARQIYLEDSDQGRELLEQAFEKYRKAIEFKPDFHEAWYNWRRALIIFEECIDPDDGISKIILEREQKRYKEKKSRLSDL